MNIEKSKFIDSVKYFKDGKITDNHEDYDIIECNTNFLDDINDSIQICYNKTNDCFTDDGYVDFQFMSQGIDLSKYIKQIKTLDGTNSLYFDKSRTLCYPNKDEYSFAFFLQAITNAFAYLKIIRNEDLFLGKDADLANKRTK